MSMTNLLIANGDTAQTHSGVRHIFGLKFIKTGVLSPEIGRLYHRLFSMRQTGDYDDTYDVAAEDVLPNIADGLRWLFVRHGRWRGWNCPREECGDLQMEFELLSG